MSDLLLVAQKLSTQPFLGEVSHVEALERDVSNRHYHRVSYQNGDRKTALLVELVDEMGPLGGGPRELNQNDAFVEVQSAFHEHGIRVPQIYADARKSGFFLLEDFGSNALWNVIENGEVAFMTQALELLQKIQGIYPSEESQSACVIFERSPTFEQLNKGPHEFIEYILLPKKISRSQQEICTEFIEQISEEVQGHPKVVSHYDFISHNIHVLDDGTLGVIDFQDTCLESPARDLHSLLCCRGMDILLGESQVFQLYTEFAKEQSSPEKFFQLYKEYAVHWDMRVAGRFTKLAHVDGREKYEQWIEGTTIRAAKGLKRLVSKFPRAGDLLDIVLRHVPEVSERLEERDFFLLRG